MWGTVIINILTYLFFQTDWSGGGGQSAFIDTSKFYSYDSLNYSVIGELHLMGGRIQFDTTVAQMQQTQSTFWVSACDFQFVPENSGNYLITVYAKLGTQGTGTNFAEFRVLFNGTEIGSQGIFRMFDFATQEMAPAGIFKVESLSAGVNNLIQVQYRTGSSTYYAYIENIKIVVRRINDFEYAEFESVSQTNSVSYVTKGALNFSLSSAETLLILTCAEFTGVNSGYPKYVRTVLDGNDIGSESSKYPGSSSVFHHYFYSRYIPIPGGPHNIEIQYRTDRGTAIMRRARILLIKKSEIKSIFYAEDESLSFTNSTSFQDKVTLNFSVSDTTDFILISNAYFSSQWRLWWFYISYPVELQITLDGTTVLENILYGPGFSFFNSGMEFYPFSLILPLKIPPGSHAITLRYRTTTWRARAYIRNARITLVEAQKFQFANSGGLISSYWDSGEYGETRWERIYFNAFIPPGGKILFQVAGTNDTTSWIFTGPDGSDTSYYRTSGTPLWRGLYGNRYFRYRVILERDTLSGESPVLYNVGFLYFKDYYVDEPEGNDNNFGRRNEPFLTINRALSLMKDSDGCIVRTGRYFENLFISPSLTGTSEFPTFFTADTLSFPEILSYDYEYAIYDSGANWVKIKDFIIRSGYLSAIYLKNAEHIYAYDNKIYVYDGSYGFVLENIDSSLLLKGNLMDADTGSSFPFGGILIDNSSYIDVDSNIIRNMEDIGTSAGLCQNITYSRNLIYNIYTSAIVIHTSSTCSLLNNTIDSCESGFQFFRVQNEAVALNNSITNCEYGFYWADGQGNILSNYNNLWNNQSNYTSPGGYTVPQGPNDIFADPLYNPDYTLRPGSPNIDAGVYVGFPYYGSAPDIGAYEFTLISKKIMDFLEKKEDKKDKKLKIYMRKENDGIRFFFGDFLKSNDLKISIFNTTGRKVYERWVRLQKSNEGYFVKIKDNLPAGLYFIRLKNRDFFKKFKIFFTK